MGEYSIGIENAKALEDRHQYFAGVIGPDAYPDIATGQQAVHPDNRPGGVYSDQWLSHLWDVSDSETYRDKPWVRAFVLGFLSHAAGDLYGHTFINNYAGGTFELGYNAVKHVVLEGYIDKRTPSPANQQYSIAGLESFMYDAMIDMRPDANRFSPPLFGPGSEFSVPGIFSALRLELERDVADYHNKVADYKRKIAENRRNADDCYEYNVVCKGFWNGKAETVQFELSGFMTGTRGKKAQYSERWISDIEAGLRDWPRLSHDIAQAVTYNFAGGTDFDRVGKLVNDYFNNHLLSMMGAPDQVGEFAAIADEVVDEALSAVPALKERVDAMKADLYYYLIESATGIDAKEVKTKWEGYLKSPESYFDAVMSEGSGEPISIKRLNQEVLHLDDPGFSSPLRPETYTYWRFPPAYNTVTMIKLLLMAPSEVRRLMKDLGSPVANDTSVWQGFDGAMLGFLHSLDADNQWCVAPSKMIIARDPNAYRQIFMQQTGEKACALGAGAGDAVSPSGNASTAKPSGTITADRLNVRSGPNVNEAIIGSLSANQEVEIAGQASGWWRIRFVHQGGEHGWVNAKYISTQNAGSVPKVSAPSGSGGTTSASSAKSVTIVLRHSGKCIRTIDGDRRAIPIQIEQASCKPDYLFTIEQVPGASGYFYIKATFDKGVIGCVGVPDIVKQSFGNGAAKVGYCAPTPAFMWRIVPLAGANAGWNLLKIKGDEAFCLGIENYASYYGMPASQQEDKRLLTVNYCADDPWQMVALRAR